jgi:hypothetical protein
MLECRVRSAEQLTGDRPEPAKCQERKQSFIPRRKDTLYCSNKCRQKDYRDRG